MVAARAGARSVVVDSSIAVKWLINEPDSEVADALLGYWSGAGRRLVAPFLLPMEVTNVVHQQRKRGAIDPANSERILDELGALPIALEAPARLHHRALDIAGQLGHGAAYDAHYLALAEIVGAECWTADGRLYRSASQAFPFLRLLGEPTPGT
jgi:predicted nucleic acid-binding protein